MIIIERSYRVACPEGGGDKTVVDRKSFNDNDTTGVDALINERGTIPGYPWKNVNYNIPGIVSNCIKIVEIVSKQ